ncbi:glycoside hydrolase family 79 protein [Hypoxylon sp. CI-4A]|nr:glycoside hydrolase family 79 protein [Hypoxylon sp. CI-4A]
MAKPTAHAVASIASAADASQPLDGFISYSIEFSSFPDFAGNKSNPNNFSNNLLENLGALAGIKPYIRVGGNTQDFAIYNSELTVALNGTYNDSLSIDYPTKLEIGSAYFESYDTWPNVKFSHGFNLGGNHDDRQWETLLQTAALACKALGKDKLYLWEYGNEPDLFTPAVRPSDYNESDYVAEWLNGTRAIRSVFEENCPDLLDNDTYGYLAPSFAGTNNHLKAPLTWADGLDADQNIKLYSSHNYISGAQSPGVTLQGTLMNHTSTTQSIAQHLAENASLHLPPGVPYILGETNSLYNEGRPGLSNAFGAALWGVDFSLYGASVGVGRVHFHMGTDYRYAAWQPIPTAKTAVGTKPPYYGNVAAAAFLGSDPVSILEIAFEGDGADPETDVAYAAFGGVQHLRRVLVLNLREYNYTLDGTGGPDLNPTPRPLRTYSFSGLGAELTQATVRRLHANGSDAITGITWDGWSYNYELDEGRPVRLENVTTGETVAVEDGVVAVNIPDSEVVILDFGTE